MFSRLQKARGILAALAATAIAFAPFGVAAQPSAAPKVISVSVSGNVHVPTDRILSVVRTKAGEPLDEATLRPAGDLRPRLFRRPGAAANSTAAGRRVGHVPRGRESGDHTHCVRGQH